MNRHLDLVQTGLQPSERTLSERASGSDPVSTATSDYQVDTAPRSDSDAPVATIGV